MSFGQLPEELVAQVASHVGPEDMVNLLQTQKRVNGVMKKYRMDKTTIEWITFNLTNEVPFPDITENIPVFYNKFSYKSYGKKEKALSVLLEIKYALSKFRFVNGVAILAGKGFTLNNELATIIQNSKTKIKRITLAHCDIDLKPKEFVDFFAKDFVVDFLHVKYNPKIFCDDVFCQISLKNDVHFTIFAVRNNEVVELSDRWLATLATAKTKSHIHIVDLQTNFTVRGIRRYIELNFDSLIQNPDDYLVHFGLLAVNQRESANQWMNLANKNTELEYSIRKEDERYTVYCNSNPESPIATFGKI